MLKITTLLLQYLLISTVLYYQQVLALVSVQVHVRRDSSARHSPKSIEPLSYSRLQVPACVSSMQPLHRYSRPLFSSLTGDPPSDEDQDLPTPGEGIVRRFDGELRRLYSKTLKIRCPFFRRRSFDILDSLSMTLKFIVARHKSLDIPLQKNPLSDFAATTEVKASGLPLPEILELIKSDWKIESGKGYYITGKLHAQIYSDYCLFDGPDPDMPVKGLKKYLSSSSQLFDHKSSRAQLIAMTLDADARIVTARWRLEGRLNLPWHPKIKAYTGTTRYLIGKGGLVESHLEEWDIGVLDAFMSTIWEGWGRPPAKGVEYGVGVEVKGDMGR